MPLDRSGARAVAQILGDDPPDPGTPGGLRELMTRIGRLNGPGPRLARESEQTVPGTDVRVRLLGVAEPPDGLIVMLGLGGWVAGTPAAHETVARKLAERTSCDVALIDFRPAPEHSHPGPADDVYAAARWLWHERAALGLGDTPMMMLGEGMGAALAADTVQRSLRDPAGPRFDLQFLICPVIDAAADTLAEVDPGATLLPRAALDRMWSYYQPGPALHPDLPPASAPDWRDAPPTVVVTAEHDAAAAKGVAFADRLRGAGVAVAHRHFEDQSHGFFGILAMRMGERAVQHVVRAVRGYTARHAHGTLPPPDELGGWLDRVIK